MIYLCEPGFKWTDTTKTSMEHLRNETTDLRFDLSSPLHRIESSLRGHRDADEAKLQVIYVNTQQTNAVAQQNHLEPYHTISVP